MASSFDLNSLIENAKGLMEKTQQDLDKITAQSEAGAGLVKITINAKHQITALELDDSLLTESKETIAELIKSAANDATRKLDAAKQEQMNPLSSLFGIDMRDNEKK